MSKENDVQQNIKKDFDIWEKRFEQKLQEERPFDLTDHAIAILLGEIRKTFELSQHPVRYKFDKVISALVLEITNHCAYDVDDFPELSFQNSYELSRIGKEVAEIVKDEGEDEQVNELGLVRGENSAELTKTVLEYEGEGPEPFVPTLDQLRDYERRSK